MPIIIRKSRREPRQYRDTKTDEERRFYNSTAWKRARAEHRRNEPLCRECGRAGIVRAGDMVDHVVSMRNGGDSLDDANMQTLCNQHHNSKRQAESRGLGGEC